MNWQVNCKSHDDHQNLPIPSELHPASAQLEASDGWDQFEQVKAPGSGRQLHDWEAYEPSKHPESSKRLPNEKHASDDDWEAYEAVNDPASGKKLSSEGHASDDDWEAYEAVNDPASGKKLPAEGHATCTTEQGQDTAPLLAQVQQTIYVTETFGKDIADIYGSFSASDDEYPAMGITIQGAPVFVECVPFPDCAVVRHRVTDKVNGAHPAVGALWQQKLCQHHGKCRRSTIHIHPMDFPRLSGTDVRNYDSLRMNPDDPSTLPDGRPYPVILVNLTADGVLDLLGFWVWNGRAYAVPIETVRDDATIVQRAWENAQPMPFFSEEGHIARRIDQLVAKQWRAELGVNPQTGSKAIKAERSDGKRVLIRFSPGTPFGLTAGGAAPDGFRLEEYIDWNRVFNDLARDQTLPSSVEASHQTDAVLRSEDNQAVGEASAKTI